MKLLCRLFSLALLLAACMVPAEAAITVLTGTVKSQTGDGKLGLKPNADTNAPDALIAQIITKSDATITPPSSWVAITGASTTANGLQQRIYYLPAGNGDGTKTHQFNVANTASGNSSNGVIFSVQGAAAGNPVCGTGLQASGGGNQATAPNVQTQPPTCPAGSLRMAFFAINDGSVSVRLNLENSATAGPSNRAGAGATGVGLFSSYYLLPLASNGDSQSASLSGNAVSIGASVIINAAAAAPLDHIQLELSGTPLTCTPSTVTVKACADAACSTLASTATTVTLSASSGSWGANPLTFTGSTTTTLSQTTVASVTLGASSATQCYLNGVQVTNCQIGFVDSGLLLTVPTLGAGVTSSFSVKAVKKSDNSLACTPAFANVTRTVDFWTNYTSPATGTKVVAVNGTSVNMNAVGVGSSTTSTGTPIALTFDATGTAGAIPLNYTDAGQLTLNARYDGSAGTSDTNLVMTGNTAFVSVPYALCVESVDGLGVASTNWGCSPADTSCSKTLTAGSSFNLRVSAKAYVASTATCSLPNTPNFKQSGIPLSTSLIAPAGGNNTNVLSPASIDISSGGTATNTTQSIAEVGIFTITAAPLNYFGQAVPAGTSANSGRFIPAGFTFTQIPAYDWLIDRSDINTGTTETCASSFTYQGESLRAQFRLTAVNAVGNKTLNYTGGFARLGLASNADLYFGIQNVPLAPGATTLPNSRLTASCVGACGSWSNGVADVRAPLMVNRAAAEFFGAVRVGVKARERPSPDGDGITLQSPDYDWALSGSNDGRLIGATQLYFGRMRVENAYGSPLLSLRVPMYAQFWNGTTFVKNTSDSCTQLTVPSSVAMDSTTPAALYCNGGVGLYGSLTGVSVSFNGTAAAGTATLVAGDAGSISSPGVLLSKPTNSGGGYLDFVPLVPSYLKYKVDDVDQGVDLTNWKCTATADGYLYDDNPRARIRFGVRRNDSIIYLREMY